MRRHLPSSSGWKVAGAAGVTAALFVPLMILGGPAFARTGAAASEYEYSSASQYQYRVTICHSTHSRKHPWVLITISSSALPAHERHGDHVPPCSPMPLTGGEHHGHGDHGGSSAGGTTGGENQSASANQGSSGGHENAGAGATSGTTSGSEHGNSGSHGDNGGDHGSTGGQGGEHGGGHGKP